MDGKAFASRNLTACQSRSAKDGKLLSSSCRTLHQNVFVELLLSLKEILLDEIDHETLPGYIQLVAASPFTVHAYSADQFILHAPHEALYLDSTGSVCREIKGQNKRVFYYSLVRALMCNTFYLA